MNDNPASGEYAGQTAARGGGSGSSEPASEQSVADESANGEPTRAEPVGGRQEPRRHDPMQGLPGVFAAVLVLESIVVLLGLLVVGKFASGPIAPLGLGLVLALAAAMIAGAGMQRRSWGLGYALALQVLLIVCAVFSPPLGLMGLVFGAVWVALLLMRREAARRLAAGRPPSR